MNPGLQKGMDRDAGKKSEEEAVLGNFDTFHLKNLEKPESQILS